MLKSSWTWPQNFCNTFSKDFFHWNWWWSFPRSIPYFSLSITKLTMRPHLGHQSQWETYTYTWLFESINSCIDWFSCQNCTLSISNDNFTLASMRHINLNCTKVLFVLLFWLQFFTLFDRKKTFSSTWWDMNRLLTITKWTSPVDWFKEVSDFVSATCS